MPPPQEYGGTGPSQDDILEAYTEELRCFFEQADGYHDGESFQSPAAAAVRASLENLAAKDDAPP